MMEEVKQRLTENFRKKTVRHRLSLSIDRKHSESEKLERSTISTEKYLTQKIKIMK